MLTGVPFFNLIQVALCLMAFWVVWSSLSPGRGWRGVVLGSAGILLGFVPVALIGGGTMPLEEDAIRMVLLGGAAILIWSVAGPAAIAGGARVALDKGTSRGLAVAIGVLVTLAYAALLLTLMRTRG